ncbi:MAG: hypothetical protein JO031_07530 [Ktedonobacteraceae bacterium]|nr:hypothetical protein [Ktedonobacteraceae bacterium]
MSHSISPDEAQTMIVTEAADESKNTGDLIEDEDTSKNPVAEVEEEDEDRRRRSALVDFSLPLVADAIAGQPTANVPTVQGTPQIIDAPTIPGTPPIRDKPPFEGKPHSPGGGGTTHPLVLPDPGTAFTGSLAQGSPHPGRPLHVPNKPKPQQPPGCIIWLLVAILVPMILLGSIVGLSFTLFSPTLTLEGSTTIAVGGTLHLHGSHFIPGNRVTCILDGSTPLSPNSAAYPVSGGNTIAGTLVLANQRSVPEQAIQTRGTSAHAAIIVGSDGTFSVTFVVSQDWQAGTHTIRATEAFSPRSATATFTVSEDAQPGTVTSDATPTKTAKATTSPTPSAHGKPGLNAITPNVIAFGPISEGYTQPTSTQVLLNTTGKDLLNWTASWDTTQAPWLRLNAQSGQVQEPGAQTLIVSAVVGNLKAGTYNTTIVFSSNGQNGQNLSLPVSLTVQAGCLRATPTTLNFTATLGANDPPAQTLALNNCRALGSWNETSTGGSWLLVSPAGGNLNGGATQSIIVSATLANVKSGAGTYQGQITFNNGTAQTVVNVTFTVAPPPTLSVNPTNFGASNNPRCKFVRGDWQCTVILSSNGAAISNLNWTATGSGVAGITITPGSGTLSPGQTVPILINIPRFPCDTTAVVTFTGPANSVTVTIIC